MIAATLDGLRVPIGSVRGYGRNPRRGDVAAIKRSLEVNGQYRPIVVNRRSGEVLAGNHTLAAAVELGWDEIAATFVDVDDEQAARIVLADNRLSDLAGYDDGELAGLLAALERDFDGTGFAPLDLDRLLAQLERQRGPGADTDPGPVPAEPRSHPGDLWLLGEHRLVCGDATDAAALELALSGATAGLVMTDPPYGVDYTGGAGGKVRPMAGDKSASLYASSLPLIRERLVEDGALYLWFSDSRAVESLGAADEAGFRRRAVLLWVKDVPTGSLIANYIPRHEPLLYASQCAKPPRWFGPTNEVTVWEHPKPRTNDLHPTQKPLPLIERALGNSSRPGELVLDPFVGSGTTVIACENLGRRCAAVEIDPGYCDVTVDRWERHTGGKAERADV